MTIFKPPTEHEEQTALMRWAQTHLENPGLLFAIPNGGIRTPRNAKTLKNEGVKRGVPDLFLAQPVGNYHGLFIEMKRRDPSLSKLSQEQAKMLGDLAHQRYACEVCYGCLEAINAIKKYLSNNEDLLTTEAETIKRFAARENQ